MLSVRDTCSTFWSWRPVGPAASFPRLQGISVLYQTLSHCFINRAAAQKFSTPLFPGRGNGISWRGWHVGGEVPLITWNTLKLSVVYFFSPSVSALKFPGMMLNTVWYGGFSPPSPEQAWSLLLRWHQFTFAGTGMIPALDPQLRNRRLQESSLWRDHNPSSFNQEFAKGSLRHHLALILDLLAIILCL